MTIELHYPNGMPIPLRDIWDVVDQFGMILKNEHDRLAEAAAKKLSGNFQLAEADRTQAIEARDRLMTFLVREHGDQLDPAARHTLVTKETNDAGRHYRKGEYRLFLGNYSTFIVELGVTEDRLDIDPKAFVSLYQVLDDDAFRTTKTAPELKKLLKAYMDAQAASPQPDEQ